MKRVVTALVLIPAVLYVVLAGPSWLVLGVVAIVAGLCYHEFCGIAAEYGVSGTRPAGFVAGVMLLGVPEDGLLLVTALAMAGLSVATRSGDLREVLPRAAFLVFGVTYIFGAWRYAVLLREASPYWLLFALAINWVGDVSAYYVGSKIGVHKLAREISPAKSWEGAIASLAISVVFGVFYLQRVLPQTPWWAAMPLSAVVNIAGQTGDLAESALKRGAGVKDSGTLLPGHGGMLDRVDSTLFALPTVYLYLRLFGGR